MRGSRERACSLSEEADMAASVLEGIMAPAINGEIIGADACAAYGIHGEVSSRTESLSARMSPRGASDIMGDSSSQLLPLRTWPYTITVLFRVFQSWNIGCCSQVSSIGVALSSF